MYSSLIINKQSVEQKKKMNKKKRTVKARDAIRLEPLLYSCHVTVVAAAAVVASIAAVVVVVAAAAPALLTNSKGDNAKVVSMW